MKNNLVSKCSKALLFTSVIMFTHIASATIIYDESSDGDLDAIGSTNVDLVSGINQISGSINQTPPAETDRIRFTQVDGLTVESITLSFAGTFDDANIGQRMTAALFNNAANLFDDNFNQITSGANIVASFFDSFGPETGALSKTTSGAIWDFQLSAGVVSPAQPWTLTIVTSGSTVVNPPPPPPPTDVPAPNALLLLAAACIACRVRRKATK
ncbi:hypothetical protein KJ365_16210 [Glaciecola sp. XM2]|uniref:hypothetical protein n=1 Tax=Glaciecola sp. XM2 TaxID=1914931 RepID=UPI001BDE3C59|nr:hypothetical protein [Glaciecola sp. XM2]MBT1452427.1 hypothetical protein [Glaciecola sp. XM2]